MKLSYESELDGLRNSSKEDRISQEALEELRMEMKVELERSMLKQIEELKRDHRTSLTDLEHSLQDKHILEISEINRAAREQVYISVKG